MEIQAKFTDMAESDSAPTVLTTDTAAMLHAKYGCNHPIF
jgi:hypothetical protein